MEKDNANQKGSKRRKYLGLPEQFGRNKTKQFQYIKDNVLKKIRGWQNRFLSKAGKEVLLKSVAFAMPVFSMNCFRLPAELCSELDSLLSNFWWGSSNEHRKMAWVSWKKLSVSKKQGGLGFRDLQQFNQALLANQMWKIANGPNSLLYRVLKNRYFKRSNIWNATKGYQSSYGWQSLLYGRELLTEGYQCGIGNGMETCLQEPWLPTFPPRPPNLLPLTNPTLSVASLINSETQQWDEELMRDLVDQNDHHLIRKIFLSPTETSDFKIWPYTSHGNYTARSGYHFSVNNFDNLNQRKPPLHSHPKLAQAIWSADTVPKLKHFLWSIPSKAIGTSDNLQRRNISIDPYCSRCCDIPETPDQWRIQN